MKYALTLLAAAAVALAGGCGERDSLEGRDYRDGMAVTPERVRDPVCGLACDPATARTSVYQGRTYHFCSEDCKRKFEAQPDAYVPAPPRY